MSNQENVFETILAPMTGTAVAITEVPDPIFIISFSPSIKPGVLSSMESFLPSCP